ncbi:MAG: flavodoxin [Lachnospiraceae bacterium]|nr:flavodoxin [Lachnospiraceae bacterium]
MGKVTIVYWSQGGNTGAMASAIAKGITDAGKEADIKFVSDVSVADLADCNVLALGCPAMGDEVLEESEFEPFIEELESSVSGKTLGLFGSYDWGDGQWMRDWTDRMKNAGATVLNDEGLIAHLLPDEDATAECEALGKQLADLV